jgi:ferrous iron transport protein A
MENVMTLLNAEVGREYIISAIKTDDEELESFLFSLGCYSGEPITVVSRRKHNCVVSIKDGRYNIDNDLADAISVE